VSSSKLSAVRGVFSLEMKSETIFITAWLVCVAFSRCFATVAADELTTTNGFTPQILMDCVVFEMKLPDPKHDPRNVPSNSYSPVDVMLGRSATWSTNLQEVSLPNDGQYQENFFNQVAVLGNNFSSLLCAVGAAPAEICVPQRPRVFTKPGAAAKIYVVKYISYGSHAFSTNDYPDDNPDDTNTTWTLSFTPSFTAGGFITFQIESDLGYLDKAPQNARACPKPQAIQSRATVTARMGDILMISGATKIYWNENASGFLKQIPLLGPLFRGHPYLPRAETFVLVHPTLVMASRDAYGRVIIAPNAGFRSTTSPF
jgi:hypothetical protein